MFGQISRPDAPVLERLSEVGGADRRAPDSLLRPSLLPGLPGEGVQSTGTMAVFVRLKGAILPRKCRHSSVGRAADL